MEAYIREEYENGLVAVNIWDDIQSDNIHSVVRSKVEVADKINTMLDIQYLIQWKNLSRDLDGKENARALEYPN